VITEKYDFFSPSLSFFVKIKPTFFSETIDYFSVSTISFFICLPPKMPILSLDSLKKQKNFESK
jgi:hypothetical protein